MRDHIVKELVFLPLLIYFIKEEKALIFLIISYLKEYIIFNNKTYYFDFCVSSWSEKSMILDY